MNKIIFSLFLFIIIYTYSLKYPNKIINKSKLKMNSNHYEIELINFYKNDELQNFYFIVGNNNMDLNLLKNEMKIMNFSGIFIPISIYQIKDIDYIFTNLENNLKKYDNKTNLLKPKIDNIKNFNNFLIFDQNNYIGGLFEFYTLLYKNV